MRIGFIGLGIMGKPMVRNLRRKGHEVLIYDILPQAVAQMASEGYIDVPTAAEAAACSELVITMLPNSDNVRDALLLPGGVLEGARPGQTVVDMSSISPLMSQRLFEDCAARGVTLLDAPVSGGEPKAVDGTLSIMVGGPQDAFERVKSVLLCMGASCVRVGEIGSGNIAKLANQVIVALNIAAVGEALTLAAKAGVDPQKVYQAIRGGLAGSTVLDAKAPMALARNFRPGFRLELHIKDLKNALEAAHGVDAPLPLTAQILEIMQHLKAQGKEKLDHSAIMQYFEEMAGTTIEPR